MAMSRLISIGHPVLNDAVVAIYMERYVCWCGFNFEGCQVQTSTVDSSFPLLLDSGCFPN